MGQLELSFAGDTAIDMVSLMPDDVWGAKKEKKSPKKAFPALMMLSIILAAAGGVFAATVNTIVGAALIGAGVITLIAAVANFAAVKKDSGEDDLTNGIRAMLGREGKSYVEDGEFLSALIAIKAKKEAELEVAEERAATIQADVDQLTAYGDECKAFLNQGQHILRSKRAC